MRTVGIVVPTFNEENNVELCYSTIKKLFEQNLKGYRYELLFIDNFSTDNTRVVIEKICQDNSNVKAIFNARNFGFTRSVFYGITQSYCDCTILLFADLQDPPEVILEFIAEWEKGSKIVVGIKNKSKESPLMFAVRSMYYKLIKSISDIEHLEHYTGFGLYDKEFVNVLRKLDDPLPYLRGIVAELGYKRKEVYYEQNIRMHGKSSFNFIKLYDLAMLGITSYSKAIMRIAMLLGVFVSLVCVIIALVTFIMKLIYWDHFPIGNASISVGIFFIGSIQLIFIGLLSEYILNMNTRIMNRPLVIEEKRINFDE